MTVEELLTSLLDAPRGAEVVIQINSLAMEDAGVVETAVAESDGRMLFIVSSEKI